MELNIYRKLNATNNDVTNYIKNWKIKYEKQFKK